MEAGYRKKLITAGKLAVSALLLYFIFTKIPFKSALHEIEQALSLSLFFALAFFLLSKIIAAYRLNMYFHLVGVPLSAASNLKLYLLGMFYNLFLPGGIGGDAYKAYALKRGFDVSTKRVVAGLLLDRISGMVLLLVYAVVLAVSTTVFSEPAYRLSLLSLLVVGLVLYYLLARKYFSYLQPIFWKSLGYSAVVQLAQLTAVWFLLEAFGIPGDRVAYLLVFLVSSIVAVIPVTIGGIGSRELVFFYGAMWMGLQQDVAVSISILFFVITAVVSLFGIVYHFKKPELRTTGPAPTEGG